MRSYTPPLQGPVVDFRTFFSNRGVLVNYDMTGQPAGANAFGVSYQRTGVAGVPAYEDDAGWTNVPGVAATAKQAQLKVTNTAFPVTDNVDRLYDLYVYDTVGSAAGLDHVLIVPSTAGKDGSAKVADLAVGQWADIKVTLTGARAGQTAGFYVKAIEIGTQFRLYFASIARANATYNALGSAGSAAFEETLAAKFPSSVAADFAVLEAGIVDEDTYVEQGLKWKDAHFGYLRYILSPTTTEVAPGLNGLGYTPICSRSATRSTDEFSHQFMGLISPTDIDGDPNPYYDDLTNDNIPDGRTPRARATSARRTHEADETLASRTRADGRGPDDVRLAPTTASRRSGTRSTSRRRSTTWGTGPEQVPERRAVAATLVKECHAGGTTQLYIDLAGRDPDRHPGWVVDSHDGQQAAGAARTSTRPSVTSSSTTSQNLTDPANPGKKVVLKVMKKEELENVDGIDALHPNRSGDVVVVFRPPYQTDASTPGQLIAPQPVLRSARLPAGPRRSREQHQHARDVHRGRAGHPQAGADHRHAGDRRRADRVVPDGDPRAAERERQDPLRPDQGRRPVQGDHVPDGQRLPRAARPAHARRPTTSRRRRPSTRSSTSAAPRCSSRGSTGTVRRRRASTSRSPRVTRCSRHPRSRASSARRPTIDMMNDMGFSIDGLGNHNFDKGQEYLRNGR